MLRNRILDFELDFAIFLHLIFFIRAGTPDNLEDRNQATSSHRVRLWPF